MVVFLIIIVGMLFVPLSPLVFISSILTMKLCGAYYEYLTSNKKIIYSLAITIVIGVTCVLIAHALPYNNFYPVAFRRFCETIGVINIYFVTKIFFTKAYLDKKLTK